MGSCLKNSGDDPDLRSLFLSELTLFESIFFEEDHFSTPPKFNLALKNDGWKTSLSFLGPGTFSGAFVS